jgi:hypothetical protein
MHPGVAQLHASLAYVLISAGNFDLVEMTTFIHHDSLQVQSTKSEHRTPKLPDLSVHLMDVRAANELHSISTGNRRQES